MEYLMILLLIFIAVLFLMQVVFFEITKSKMEKMNNINWFLSLDKPFNYNRVGYMVFLCFICYLISSPAPLFSLEWFIYFALFLAMGIVADAVVQYAILIYSKKDVVDKLKMRIYYKMNYNILHQMLILKKIIHSHLKIMMKLRF